MNDDMAPVEGFGMMIVLMLVLASGHKRGEKPRRGSNFCFVNIHLKWAAKFFLNKGVENPFQII